MLHSSVGVVGLGYMCYMTGGGGGGGLHMLHSSVGVVVGLGYMCYKQGGATHTA